MKGNFNSSIIPTLMVLLIAGCHNNSTQQDWTIDKREYFSKPGASVLVFHNHYPVGRQGGIEIILHEERIATNGFLQLESGTGRRLPRPESAVRQVDSLNQIIHAAV
ncbi:MAG TPA: hypothetical protein VI583_01350, partial [Cyclobacteriaceae bacterium]|nr:hypothetical protein [Cyclobacteriaceae bacterium]